MYYYKNLDIQYVKDQEQEDSTSNKTKVYKAKFCSIIKHGKKYDKRDISIVFRASPDSLVNLASRIVDQLPLPSVFTWSEMDVRRWIDHFGYPQYKETFRLNYINGRTLLLVDASGLSAMNIKDFDHIKHITYGIRNLFWFELVKFARSISLPDHEWADLFKLFRVKKSYRNEQERRSDLFRKMQLLSEVRPPLTHWERLERWLRRIPLKKYPELIGDIRRENLYKCKQLTKSPPQVSPPRECSCMPPCTCGWTEIQLRQPRNLSCLENRPPHTINLGCERCMNVCSCKWAPHMFKHDEVLSVLHRNVSLKATKHSTFYNSIAYLLSPLGVKTERKISNINYSRRSSVTLYFERK